MIGDETSGYRASWTRGSRSDGWFFVGLFGLLVIPVVAAFAGALGRVGLPNADIAVIELHTLDVPDHLPLYGVYSRFGFHHPGPLLYYAAAVPLRLFGPDGLMVAAAIVNLLAFLGLLTVLYRRGGQVLCLIGAAFALLLSRAIAGDLVSIWNVWMPIIPFAVAITLTWSVWCRDWWALPWLAGVMTWVVQNHVGYAPASAVLLGSSFGWALLQTNWRRRQRIPTSDGSDPRRCRPLTLLVAVGVLFVLWLPPLIDQLTGHPGNISAILDFVRSPRHDLTGAGHALGVLARQVGFASPLLGFGLPMNPLTKQVSGAPIPVLIPAILLAIVAAVLAIRARAHDALRFQGLVALLIAVGWLSVARIAGPAFPYLVDWLWVLAVFLWMSTLWSLLSSVWPRVSAVRVLADPGSVHRSTALAVVAVVVLLGLTAWATTSAANGTDELDVEGRVTDQFAGPAEHAASGQGLILVSARGKGFGPVAVAAGLQAELVRRGLDAVNPDSMAYEVGTRYSQQGRDVGGRLVVVDEASLAEMTKTQKPIALYDRLSPSERQELQTLQAQANGGQDRMSQADRARLTELSHRSVRYGLFFLPGPTPGGSANAAGAAAFGGG
jgi:hypothetical protein